MYAGDYEIRGLERHPASNAYVAPLASSAHPEVQYVVAGARLVWRDVSGSELDEARNRRLTVPLADIIQTTAATLDLLTGDLVEASTYYPNGARETLLIDDTDPSATEPSGFIGKEGDEEVGLTYFGERYLISRLGRWASPDPLHVHAMGGGETLNSYHYVAGNLLQTRDPVGLDPPGAAPALEPPGIASPPDDSGVRARPQPQPGHTPPQAPPRAPPRVPPPVAPVRIPPLLGVLLIAVGLVIVEAIIEDVLTDPPQHDEQYRCVESGGCRSDGTPRTPGADPDRPATGLPEQPAEPPRAGDSDPPTSDHLK